MFDHSMGPHDHLRGVNVDMGGRASGYVTIGADADSYFEYLIKVWVYGGMDAKVRLRLGARHHNCQSPGCTAGSVLGPIGLALYSLVGLLL